MSKGEALNTRSMGRETLSFDRSGTGDDGKGGDSMNESILFACTANICRSPLMHYTFASEVDRSRPLTIRSAGTTAQIGSTMCATALSLVPSRSRDLAAKHMSSSVEDIPLDASLVIVASRTERAVIARAFPEVRPRLFTLTEAVLLGRFALSKPKPGASPDESMSLFAQLIDAQRGMITIPRNDKRGGTLFFSRAHPFDIPDAHHSNRFAHRNALKRLRAEAVELATLIRELQDTHT